MTEFETLWRQYYPGLNPVGFMLRRGGARNWLRFHSLPESKRYAGTSEEWEILLARQNLLAGEVLGPEPCWVVECHYVHPKEGTRPYRYFAKRFRNWRLEPAFDFLDDEDDDPDGHWTAYAAETVWRDGQFDEQLRAIANDELRILWFSPSREAIFAPYDGGIDLFLPDAEAVSALSARLAAWLSSHPEGL